MSRRRGGPICRLLACLLLLALGGCAPGGEAPATIASSAAAPTPAATPAATSVATPPAPRPTAGPGATTAPPPAATATSVAPPTAPTTPPRAATPTGAPTAAPTATRPPPPTATATPAPVAPTLVRLTAEGCCPRPRWLASGDGVFYYGPNGGQLGTWAVPRGGGAPRRLAATYGTFSPDGQLVATRSGVVTTIARLDGTPLGRLTTGAALVFIAPTGDRIAWLVPDPALPQVSSSLEPPARVHVATIGPAGVGAARALDPIVRAEVLHWLPDGRGLVLSTRDERGVDGGIAVLDAESGAIRRIAAGNFLESLAVSPDGTGLVYTAVLQPTAAENGVWYVRLDGSGRRKLPLTGGYRWRPDGRGLLFIPAPAGGPTDELRAYALDDGAITTLVAARQAQFLVASDEWELAPDGRAIAFRSAADGAIWTLTFGP